MFEFVSHSGANPVILNNSKLLVNSLGLTIKDKISYDVYMQYSDIFYSLLPVTDVFSVTSFSYFLLVSSIHVVT